MRKISATLWANQRRRWDLLRNELQIAKSRIFNLRKRPTPCPITLAAFRWMASGGCGRGVGVECVCCVGEQRTLRYYLRQQA